MLLFRRMFFILVTGKSRKPEDGSWKLEVRSWKSEAEIKNASDFGLQTSVF